MQPSQRQYALLVLQDNILLSRRPFVVNVRPATFSLHLPHLHVYLVRRDRIVRQLVCQLLLVCVRLEVMLHLRQSLALLA